MGHNELKLKIINEECRIKNLDIESSNPMRLEDAISVAPYIHSGAEYVRGQKNKGDEARLRHLKINAIHLDES